ncbi:MAG: radical SAM protein [Planctomycetota bacterium]
MLLDEVRVRSHLWAAAPRQVSVALTNACDLACPFCYAPKHPAVLDVETVAAWLDELDAAGCLGVGFGGGEPTLHPRFAWICRYAAERTGLAVTFTTHAHRIDEELVDSLRCAVHFVRVSMDGVGHTYSSSRGRPFGEFRSRLETVRKLATFGINFVVNSSTLADLDAAISFARDVGAAEFLLLPERSVAGRGGIDASSAQALRQWVGQYRGTLPLSVSEGDADGMPTCSPLEAEGGLRAYVHIDASGALKQASFVREGVRIGADGVMRALARLQDTVVRQARQ